MRILQRSIFSLLVCKVYVNKIVRCTNVILCKGNKQMWLSALIRAGYAL